MELDDGTKIPIVRKPAARAANAPSVRAGVWPRSRECFSEGQGLSRRVHSGGHSDLGIRRQWLSWILGSRGEPAVICEAPDLSFRRGGAHCPVPGVQSPFGELLVRQQEFVEEPSGWFCHSPSSGDGAHGNAVGRSSSRRFLQWDPPCTGRKAPSSLKLPSRDALSEGRGPPLPPAGASARAGSQHARAVRRNVEWKFR